MKKRLLYLVLALAALTGATAANAYDITASCPYDGDTAYFAGAKPTVNGTVCHYTHQHWDSEAKRTVTHSFWVACSE